MVDGEWRGVARFPFVWVAVAVAVAVVDIVVNSTWVGKVAGCGYTGMMYLFTCYTDWMLWTVVVFVWVGGAL